MKSVRKRGARASIGQPPGEALAAIVGRNPYRPAKVVLDYALAVPLLILSLPLIGLSIALVKLTSRGPAFYAQWRLGLHGRPYRIFKIRSMYHECEKQSGPRWATARDPRVTAVGRLLRATHLDELPQLWNVLRGEMSLVGPRPERPEFVGSLELALPRYRERLLVRPGITGLAQVQLPPDTDLASVARKLECDLHYVEHFDPWLDCKLIATTGLCLVRVPFGIVTWFFPIPTLEVTGIEGDDRADLVPSAPQAWPA